MGLNLDGVTLTSILARDTNQVYVQLLTFFHPSWGTPTVRLVRNNKDFVSRTNTYKAFPFEAILPSSVEGQVPQGKLTMGAGDPVIIANIRSIVRPLILVTIEIVRAVAPDTVFYSFNNLYLRKVFGSDPNITGILTYDDILKQPFTSKRITPLYNPGVFG